MLAVFQALSSYKPLKPWKGEPRQSNKDDLGLSGAIGPYQALLGCPGSPSLGSTGFLDDRPLLDSGRVCALFV